MSNTQRHPVAHSVLIATPIGKPHTASEVAIVADRDAGTVALAIDSESFLLAADRNTLYVRGRGAELASATKPILALALSQGISGTTTAFHTLINIHPVDDGSRCMVTARRWDAGWSKPMTFTLSRDQTTALGVAIVSACDHISLIEFHEYAMPGGQRPDPSEFTVAVPADLLALAKTRKALNDAYELLSLAETDGANVRDTMASVALDEEIALDSLRSKAGDWLEILLG
jgi:hypothetical protein